MNQGHEERNDSADAELDECARLAAELRSLVMELRGMHIRLAVIGNEVLHGQYTRDCIALALSADPALRRRGLERLRRLVANGRRTVGWVASDALDEIRAEQERRRRARGERP